MAQCVGVGIGKAKRHRSPKPVTPADAVKDAPRTALIRGRCLATAGSAAPAAAAVSFDLVDISPERLIFSLALGMDSVVQGFAQDDTGVDVGLSLQGREERYDVDAARPLRGPLTGPETDPTKDWSRAAQARRAAYTHSKRAPGRPLGPIRRRTGARLDVRGFPNRTRSLSYPFPPVASGRLQ